MTDQRRALLTEREREILSGEADVTTNYRYSIESRVRTRLRERLPVDIKLIREEYPEMFDELVYPAVCEPSGTVGAGEGEEAAAVVDAPREPPEPADEAATDTEASGADLPEEIDAEVWAVVDDVAEGWDEDSRLENRRQAAAHVLQHAVNTGEAVGKSHPAVDHVIAEFPVEGQNRETYWRKNVRDVLADVGEYNNGKHGYTVEELP